MDRDAHVRALIAFLTEKLAHHGADLAIGENTPLVSSGLVDSFALIELLLELERVTNRRIPAGRVSPEDFETIQTMLAAAARVGAPR